MKKISGAVLILIAVCTAFSGCTPLRAIPAELSGEEHAKFVGTWTLNPVTYSGLIEGAVTTVFDQAPPKDFTGSTWELTNSGNGSYTLANGAKQTIYWSVNGGDALGPIFQFKKTNKGESPQNVTSGYQLTVSNNNGTTMTLKSLVYMGNKNGYVVYTFTKTKP